LSKPPRMIPPSPKPCPPDTRTPPAPEGDARLGFFSSVFFQFPSPWTQVRSFIVAFQTAWVFPWSQALPRHLLIVPPSGPLTTHLFCFWPAFLPLGGSGPSCRQVLTNHDFFSFDGFPLIAPFGTCSRTPPFFRFSPFGVGPSHGLMSVALFPRQSFFFPPLSEVYFLCRQTPVCFLFWRRRHFQNKVCPFFMSRRETFIDLLFRFPPPPPLAPCLWLGIISQLTYSCPVGFLVCLVPVIYFIWYLFVPRP